MSERKSAGLQAFISSCMTEQSVNTGIASTNKSTVCYCFRNLVCHPNPPYLVSPKPWEAWLWGWQGLINWFIDSGKTSQTVRSDCLYGWRMAETSLFYDINLFFHLKFWGATKMQQSSLIKLKYLLKGNILYDPKKALNNNGTWSSFPAIQNLSDYQSS